MKVRYGGADSHLSNYLRLRTRKTKITKFNNTCPQTNGYKNYSRNIHSWVSDRWLGKKIFSVTVVFVNKNRNSTMLHVSRDNRASHLACPGDFVVRRWNIYDDTEIYVEERGSQLCDDGLNCQTSIWLKAILVAVLSPAFMVPIFACHHYIAVRGRMAVQFVDNSIRNGTGRTHWSIGEVRQGTPYAGTGMNILRRGPFSEVQRTWGTFHVRPTPEEFNGPPEEVFGP